MSNRKKKESGILEEAIGDLAKDKVAEAVEEQLREAAPGDTHEDSINDLIRTIASQVPENNNVYIKLYKKYPLPDGFEKHGQVYLAMIPNVMGIDDIEVHVADLVNKNDWGTGIYQLRVYRSDKKGLAIKPIELSIYAEQHEIEMGDMNRNIHGDRVIEKPYIIDRGGNGKSDTLDEIDRVADLAGKLVEIGGKRVGVQSEINPTASPESMMTAITSAMKMGMEMVMTAMPKPDTSRNSKSEMLEVITLLKELGVIGNPSKESDPLEKLMQMKQMAELLGMGGGDGGEQSPLNLLITTLGSRIPDMVKDVSGPIKSFLDMKRVQLEKTPGAIKSPARPQPPSSDVSSLPNDGSDKPSIAIDDLSAPIQSNVQKLAEAKANIFLTELQLMIESNNKDFENVMNGIAYTFGKNFLDQYRIGQLTEDMVINLLQIQNEFFKTEPAIVYLKEFFNFVNHHVKQNNYICNNEDCKTVVSITESEFKEDSICDACGIGQLIKMGTMEVTDEIL